MRETLRTSEISANSVTQPMVDNDATVDLQGMAIAEATVGPWSRFGKIEIRPSPGKDRLAAMLNAEIVSTQTAATAENIRTSLALLITSGNSQT